MHRAAAVLGFGLLVHRDVESSRDATRLVVATEHLADGAAVNLHLGAVVGDIGAVAAAEDIADGVAAIDGNVGAGDRGSVAAAIDIFYTVVAVVHLHHRGAAIGCLVAAAEHMAEGVAALGLGGGVDVHVHRALRRAVGVVAAIDASRHRAAIDHHLHLAVHLSFGHIPDTFLSQAAAVEVAVDGAALEPHLGDFA